MFEFRSTQEETVFEELVKFNMFTVVGYKCLPLCQMYSGEGKDAWESSQASKQKKHGEHAFRSYKVEFGYYIYELKIKFIRHFLNNA